MSPKETFSDSLASVKIISLICLPLSTLRSIVRMSPWSTPQWQYLDDLYSLVLDISNRDWWTLASEGSHLSSPGSCSSTVHITLPNGCSPLSTFSLPRWLKLNTSADARIKAYRVYPPVLALSMASIRFAQHLQLTSHSWDFQMGPSSYPTRM